MPTIRYWRSIAVPSANPKPEYIHSKEDFMRFIRFPTARSYGRLFMPLFIIPALLISVPARGEDRLASVVADGKPWEMYVVKRKASNILVFRPDGVGTISDSIVSISATWRAVPDGICISPQPGQSEKCLHLTRTKAGIEASQNGKTVWVLKR